MSRRPSSGRWKQRQIRDPYVRRAQLEGWRSRAAFKLMEIDRRDRLLRRGAVVLDLGAAPGGWSQFATRQVGPEGQVIAVDLLEMEPIPGVRYIRGEFADESTLKAIDRELAGKGLDLVLSDMAPNISGNWSVDQPRSMILAEAVLVAVSRLLQPGGALVLKLFQGEGQETLLGKVRQEFGTVRLRKPAASRGESREIYLVAGNYRL